VFGKRRIARLPLFQSIAPRGRARRFRSDATKMLVARHPRSTRPEPQGPADEAEALAPALVRARIPPALLDS
jgi:hypothetical protein